MVALSNFDDSFLVLLSDVMERLGRVTSSTLFNLVPRHLGEQLLELEADIKNMFANHKQARIEQNRMILESERDKEDQLRLFEICFPISNTYPYTTQIFRSMVSIKKVVLNKL